MTFKRDGWRRHHRRCVWFVVGWLLVAANAAAQPDEESVLEVVMNERSVVNIWSQVRHTTIIVLPEDERILDFVIGDGDFWALSGADRTAYVKPLEEGVASNVSLVCESGRVYAFLVRETVDRPPHLVVRVSRAETAPAPARELVFTHRRAIEDVQAATMTAEARVAAITAAADAAVTRTEAATAATVAEFRETYPSRLRFRYQLDAEARAAPFLVSAMWDDGVFTYLKSGAQESPALYELKDEAPSLVAYDLTEEGLYIARHVLEDGWLQIGEAQAGWIVNSADVQRNRRQETVHRGITAVGLVLGSLAVWALAAGGS